MTDNHKHWITVIETDAPDVYDGARIGVCHSKEEAEEDILEWITDYANGDAAFDGHLDTAEKAMAKYTEYTDRHCKIEEQ